MAGLYAYSVSAVVYARFHDACRPQFYFNFSTAR